MTNSCWGYLYESDVFHWKTPRSSLSLRAKQLRARGARMRPIPYCPVPMLRMLSMLPMLLMLRMLPGRIAARAVRPCCQTAHAVQSGQLVSHRRSDGSRIG